MKIFTDFLRQISLCFVLFFAFSFSVFGAVYEKVTSTPSDWSGQYLIVYEAAGLAFDGSRTTLDAVSNAKTIKLSNSQISINEDNFYFTIAKSGSNYTIKSASGYYIGQTSDANGLKSNKTTTYSNAISLNNDGSVNLVSEKAYLRYNAASGQYRFRYYKSSSYTGQKAICLYKLVEDINKTPIINVAPTTINFGNIEQNTEARQTFIVTGTNLTNSVTLTSNNSVFSIDKISITPNGETIEENISITLNTENIGEKSGVIIIQSEGAESVNIDVSANIIAPRQNFNVNFWHNGERIFTKQVKDGESLGEFPNIPNLESCNPNLPIFVGWTSEIEEFVNVENETPPAFFNLATPIIGETNLYAVFANVSDVITWNRVTNVAELIDGSKVLIVCPSNSVAAGTQNGKYRNSTSVTLSDDKNQVSDIQNAKIFTLGNTSSGYSFYSDDESHYMVLTSSDNVVNTVNTISSNSASHYWSITISNGTTSITNKNYGTRKLQYNASSPRFACYTSNQTAISLYKQTSTSATKWTVCIPTYSSTFNINATDKIVVNDILSGTAISDLAGIPTLLNTCNTDFLSFAGWTTNTETLGGYAKPEIVTTITDNVDLYPVFSNAYAQLVTDESQLQVNDKIIIAATDCNYALSTNQKTNNRGQVEIIKVDNKIGLNDSVQIITLQEGAQENTFVFYVVGSRTGYLYAASSSNNYLKTRLSLDENGSTDWDMSITNSIATLKSKGTYTRNMLGYNASDKLFSCYSGNKKNISIYEIVDATQWIVCHNSTLSIESGDTLNVVANTAVDNLTIKSNYDQAAQINVTAGSLTAQKVIVEKTIDASRYYFFSLPFDCNITDIVATDASANSLNYYNDYTIFYYDQDTAANNKGAMGSKAWVEIIDKNATIKANQGYIIGYLVDEGIATIKFKSLISQTISAPETTTLSIEDYTWYTDGGVPTANGWNLIGMPYYQKPNNGSLSADINVYYATMPNDDGKTYTQTTFADADIAPFTSFFVQTEVAPTFTISAQQNAAPRLTDGRANTASQQKAVIAFADANGGKDQTTIINNQNTTADYEIGHDLVKWIGYAAIPQIYSIQGDDILAFNSRAIDNSTVIPLGVYAHADGEYTFSLDAKSVGDLQGWELYDNEEGKTIRLANETLTVYLEKGKHEGRFELRLQQRVATDCDIAMSNMQTWVENGKLNIDNMPVDARVYIYDAVGRMLYADNEVSASFSYDLPGRGVYSIVVSSAVETIAFKTIY